MVRGLRNLGHAVNVQVLIARATAPQSSVPLPENSSLTVMEGRGYIP